MRLSIGQKISKLTFVIFLPISIYYVVDLSLRLDLSPQVLYQSEDIASIPVGRDAYPYYKLLQLTRSYESPLVSGAIFLPPKQGEKLEYLYIPYFSGDLSVFLNGASIFESKEIKLSAPINKYESTLIPLKHVYPDRENLIEVTLSKSSRIFVALSYVYIGSYADFSHAVLMRDIFNEKLPFILWGVTCLAIISLVFVFVLTRNVFEILPFTVISVFIFSGTSSKVFSDFVPMGPLLEYTLYFSSMLVVAIYKFQENITQEVERSNFIWIVSAIVSSLLLIVGICFTHLMSYINLLVNVPIVIIGLAYALICSLRAAVIGGGQGSVFFSMSIFSILFAIFHDVMIRFGYFQEGAFLQTLGLTIFFISVVLTFHVEVFKLRVSLQDQKEILIQRLAERELELSIENKKNIDLIEKSAVLKEQARLTRDLHDGVLTYLSMIQALSESQGILDRRVISKISRYASQEIRLILENGGEKNQNMFVMLATFRQQVVEPLIDQGVSVDWNMLCLLDNDIIPTSSSLNLFRILQEAFHNAHVRAECKHIQVMAEIFEEDIVKITILNTGGITFSSACKNGNGIMNMKRRALMINASFDIQSIPSGAKVELIFNSHSPVVLQSVIKST